MDMSSSFELEGARYMYVLKFFFGGGLVASECRILDLDQDLGGYMWMYGGDGNVQDKFW